MYLNYVLTFCFFVTQKQNVEKAKAALLNENLDGSTSIVDNKQSDHLLMVIAYNKWSRILQEVTAFFCYGIQFLSFDRVVCMHRS